MNTAQFTHLQAIGLADPAAVATCDVWFGMTEADVEERCGRFVRGQRKGKLRGWMVWCECREAGYCYARGCEIPRGAKLARFFGVYSEMVHALVTGIDEFLRAAERVDVAEQARRLPDTWLVTARHAATQPEEVRILQREMSRRARLKLAAEL